MVASMLRAQRRDPAKAQAKCAFATNYPLANRQLRSSLILRYRMQRDKPLGLIGLLELTEYRGPFGLGIERDIHFTAAFPLSIYAEAARASGHIVESGPELEAAARILAGKPATKLTGHDGREA